MIGSTDLLLSLLQPGRLLLCRLRVLIRSSREAHAGEGKGSPEGQHIAPGPRRVLELPPPARSLHLGGQHHPFRHRTASDETSQLTVAAFLRGFVVAAAVCLLDEGPATGCDRADGFSGDMTRSSSSGSLRSDSLAPSESESRSGFSFLPEYESMRSAAARDQSASTESALGATSPPAGPRREAETDQTTPCASGVSAAAAAA